MTTPTFTMVAPSQAYTTVIGAPSGNTYVSNNFGLISNVAAEDTGFLQAGGFSIVGTGFAGATVPLMQAKNTDGSSLAASAASGKFGNAITLGTSSALVSEVASGSTITDHMIFDLILPASMPAGYNPTITIDCDDILTTGATLTTKNLIVACYPVNHDGTHQANIVTNGTQAISSGTDAALAFDTSGTVEPLGRVIVEVSANLIESAGTAAHATINQITIS